jgi:hypothetical protein
MKNSSVPFAPSQQPDSSPTPRQQPRPLGPLVELFSKTPAADSENDPRFRGAPTSRPFAFLMTAGG